jgi:deoxyadenosine/deoxycytidine kinase
MDLQKCHYVVVEGPIGAGKTSLARQLAMHLDAEMMLEQPEDNPFLSRFYADMPRFALPTQLTFLFQRADHVRGMSHSIVPRPTVADFCSAKSAVRPVPHGRQYNLYESLWAPERRPRRRTS